MTMRPTDRLISAPRGTAAAAVSYGQRNGAKRLGAFQQYIAEVLASAPRLGLDPAIVIAQSAHETDAWQSSWWESRLNPAGLGITGDPAQNDQSRTWTDGASAARSQMAHLLVYALGPVPAAELWAATFPGARISADDPRYAAYLEAYGNTVRAETIAELAGQWAVDPDYAAGVCARGNAIYPTLEDQPMPTYTTEIPGLPGGPLVTTYPIRINLIPAGRTYQRPGTKARTPRRTVIHGTGNPWNESAWDEAQYFVNGAEGRQASVHSFANDREVVIGVPLDEIAYQAADGAGPGNSNGIATELLEANAIWNNPVRRDREIAIAADFSGRVAARFGIAKAEQHYTFNFDNPPEDRHDCPNKLRHLRIGGRLAWDIFVDLWQAAKADELKRMAGTQPKPEPAWQPHPIGNEATKDGQTKYENDVLWVWVHQEQPIEVDTQTYEWADDTSRKGIILPAGKPVTAYWITTVDNELWASTRQGWRWRIADGLKQAA